MSFFQRAGFASLLALATAMPAAAEITPEQVWEFWRTLQAGTGVAVTAESQRREGDRLILEGVTTKGGNGRAQAEIPMGQVVLRDTGKGSVEMTIAPTIVATVSINEPDSEPVEMQMTIDQQGYEVVISGTPDAPVFDITADLLTLTQDSPKVNGVEMPMEMQISLSDITGVLEFDPSQGDKAFNYGFEAGTLEFAMAAADPQRGGNMEMSFAAEGLKAAFQGVLPVDVPQGADLAAMMAKGMQGAGSYQTGPVEFTFAMEEDGKEVTANGTIESTALDMALTARGVSYTNTVNNIGLEVAGSSIPFPDLAFAARTYQFGMTLPLLKSEQPEDFGLVLRLVDLVIPESIWGMFDPERRLARDPASLIVDAKGKLRLTEDLLKPQTQPSAEMPGELHALDLNELQLKAAGAELTGTGSFTFDNSDMQTIPGMPRPTGKADLRLVGGNGLMDNLVAMGLVPQDQVMGLRMMLALFARPGEGPDTLTSTIEMTQDGQILANGQRIQ